MTHRQPLSFTISIDDQPMQVDYRPDYFISYDHFEFRSPYKPPRRIPVSETGYRSHFAPAHEVNAAPTPMDYARAVAIAIRNGRRPHAPISFAQADLFG